MAKSAVRTLEILEVIARSGLGLSHGEISNALDIPKSSLTGLLRDLAANRYIELDLHSGMFRLGPQVLSLANAYLRGFDPIRAAAPHVARLSHLLGETVHIAVLDGDDILVIHHELGRHTLSAMMRIGDRAPAILTAAGRAILAHHDLQEQKRLERLALKRNPPLPGSSQTELDDIAAGAVSVIRDTWIEGVSACAVALFEPSSAFPFASISVALPTGRLALVEHRQRIEEALIRLQEEVSPRQMRLT